MPRIVGIEEHPAIARVVRVFVCLYSSFSDAKLRRGGDMDEGGCNVGTLSVLLNVVSEGLDPSKVDNSIVVVNGDGGRLLGVMWAKASIEGIRWSVQAFMASDSSGLAW